MIIAWSAFGDAAISIGIAALLLVLLLMPLMLLQCTEDVKNRFDRIT